MFKHSDTTTQDLAASARRLLTALEAGSTVAPPRPVHVPDLPGPIGAARRSLAHARTGSGSAVVSNARAVLATLERFLAVASGAPAWRAWIPEARAMTSIAGELLEIHATDAVRGV
jgi:hypothetical protein